MRHRKRFFFLLPFILILFVIASIKPITIYFLKKNIENIFVGSKVSISNIYLNGINTIILEDLVIDKASSYNISAGNIKITPRHIFMFSVYLEDISLTTDKGELLKGRIEGDIKLSLEKKIDYLSALEIEALDLDVFRRTFKLDKKFDASGDLRGILNIRGSGSTIEDMTGDFATTEDGILIIKDDRFIKNIAERSNQPFEILLESLKDYKYNKGLAGISMKEGNLIFNINLDGESGKRDFEIVVHDFNLVKEGI
ncbi:MAG: YdbH domain-containing protein [Candidatus Omnitrophota bacterium]